ncbi:MAG: prephenate dehydrogenase [Candidatus Nanopelagicaceae bacterium]|nr:prephenate dehydrogenase [Candidatus Nanopelagicaceae bacterium]
MSSVLSPQTRVRVLGSGLIGTSIALALSAIGIRVKMIDSDSNRASLAQALVGTVDAGEEAELVIFALPSSRLVTVISHEFSLNPKAIFIDIGSTKAKPLAEIEKISGMAERFCGTHPMAGREIGGPEAARADLFAGRPWVYTPTPATKSDVIEMVIALINRLGGSAIKMSVHEHDSAVALVSHLPQISASLLAKQLRDAPENWLALAGQGLRDSTRIAASDPHLWREIIGINREEILPLLTKLKIDLDTLIAQIGNEDAIAAFIAQGQAGRARIPGKHGGTQRDYSYLPIVIEDKPGQLSRVFQECEQANVNIEDLSIEHSPGQFTGLITLALSKNDAERLAAHLESQGWNVHLPKLI